MLSIIKLARGGPAPEPEATFDTEVGASVSDLSGNSLRIPENGPAEPLEREEKGDSFRILVLCHEDSHMGMPKPIRQKFH